jgi:tetratricopeptide (TPR) repeat protein
MRYQRRFMPLTAGLPLCLLLTACSSFKSAETVPAKPAPAEQPNVSGGLTPAELIIQGDKFYARFDEQGAVDSYLTAIRLEPGNYEALWKAARGIEDLSDLLIGKDPASKDKKVKMYGDAVAYATMAVAANPGDTWGHCYLSSSMGKRVVLMSIKDQINAYQKIRAEIDKAIELDGTNDLAYHGLGRWHRRAAEVGGAKRFFGGLIYGSLPQGSFAEAEAAFQKAIHLKPNYLGHHLELARTYVAMGKYDLAVPEYQKVIDLAPMSAIDKYLKAEAAFEIEKARKIRSDRPTVNEPQLKRDIQTPQLFGKALRYAVAAESSFLAGTRGIDKMFLGRKSRVLPDLGQLQSGCRMT